MGKRPANLKQPRTYIDCYIKTSREQQTQKLQQIHTQKRKSNPNNTKEGHQTTREANKRGREEKRPAKPNPKQLRKWQEEHTYP